MRTRMEFEVSFKKPSLPLPVWMLRLGNGEMIGHLDNLDNLYSVGNIGFIIKIALL